MTATLCKQSLVVFCSFAFPGHQLSDTLGPTILFSPEVAVSLAPQCSLPVAPQSVPIPCSPQLSSSSALIPFPCLYYCIKVYPLLTWSAAFPYRRSGLFTFHEIIRYYEVQLDKSLKFALLIMLLIQNLQYCKTIQLGQVDQVVSERVQVWKKNSAHL